jgi:hypothetical protein
MRPQPWRRDGDRHRRAHHRSRRHRRQLAQARETAVPAECAGVIKADAYGCGLDPVARALAGAGCKTFFVATLDEARAARAALPAAVIYVLDGFFQNCGDAYRRDRLPAGDRRPQRAGRMGRVLPPLGLGRRCRHPHRHRHEPARPHDGGSPGIMPRIVAGDHGITLVMSHLACAESLNHPLNARQLAAFREIAIFIPACRPRCRIRRAFSSGRNSSSTWCGRARRSTASIRPRKPTIRCCRWSN